MSSVKKVRVMAAVLDTRKLTLYIDDGSTIDIKQGDPRLKEIVDTVVPEIRSQGYSFVEIPSNPLLYSQVEQKTNGFLKFFRIAKSKLNEIFNKEIKPFPMVGDPNAQQRMKDAAIVDEIMINAVHTDHAGFEDVPTNVHDRSADVNKVDMGGDTIIAVVDNQAVVEDAHKIKHHLTNAVKTGNTEGLENFYKRLANIIDKRRHSARDLFQFCMKGDLQFTNDGRIIVYKSLRETSDGMYVDIHSGRVTQCAGTRVFMEEKMVDENRRNECSNGLHIARRQYVGTFSGNALFITVVRPEDVIAVPEYDANKMRVCSYDLVFKLNKEDEAAIRANKPVYTEEGKKMIAAVIEGNYPEMWRFVEICGERGTNLKITTKGNEPEKVDISDQEGVSPLDYDDEAEEQLTDEPVNVEAVAQAVAPAKQPTRREQAEALYAKMVAATSGSDDEYNFAKEIEALKKKSKISWMNLMDESDANDVIRILGTRTEETKPVEPAQAEASSEPVLTQQERINSLISTPSLPAAGSHRARIEQLMVVVRKGSKRDAKTAWEEAKKVKKESKKSWTYFGVDADAINKLFTN